MSGGVSDAPIVCGEIDVSIIPKGEFRKGFFILH